MESERSPNRLINEQSPYLLQHAYNPVDWYPWGEEAFEQARTENKPIFLSIGYSTCHWCHVMERESFEDDKVASILNSGFVSIKVDREEHPDIDHLYMTVAQLMTKRAGWPLTIIMTPDKKPFFAATYLPRDSRDGMLGLIEVLPRVRRMWVSDRSTLLDAAEKVATSLDVGMSIPPGNMLEREVLSTAFEELTGSYDKEHGGFGTFPKFPSPHMLIFLMRYWRRFHHPLAAHMAEHSLKAMHGGGIYDHLAGGFHRYSTDAEWKVPHFEKMLYDQAMLALAYLEARQATGNEWYEAVARETLDFAIDEMRDDSGAFISAIDADTEGEEGGYYLWTFEELERELNESELTLATTVWGLRKEGNFPDEVTGEPSGKNVLFLPRTLSEVADELEMDESELSERLWDVRSRLLSLRRTRTHPMKDDKVLTDWNGLMIAACARASLVLGIDEYLSVAEEACEALLAHVYQGDHLLHRYRGSTAGIRGKLEDYAYLAWGLFELYEASFNTKYLELSRELVDYAIEHFFDEEKGGFFLTDEHDEAVLVRQKEIYDGALPSGNSVMMYLLPLCAALDERSACASRATQQVRAFSRHVERSPTAFTFFLCGIDLHHGPMAEVRLVGEDVSPFISALRDAYLPHAVVTVKSSRTNDVAIERLVPSMGDVGSPTAVPKAYVCIGTTCLEPTEYPAHMVAELEKMYE
jgi:hypothetical protein